MAQKRRKQARGHVAGSAQGGAARSGTPRSETATTGKNGSSQSTTVATDEAQSKFTVPDGAVLALLYYEWVHYVAHIPFVPRTPFGRWIKKYHLWHHFKNERLWFGVTNPAIDLVVRTYRRVEDAERSGSTRVLH